MGSGGCRHADPQSVPSPGTTIASGIEEAPVQPLLPEQLPERVAAAGLLLPVGLILILSTLSRQEGSRSPIAISDLELLAGVGLELVLALTIGFWLWRRGWRPFRTATRPFVPGDILRAIVLWVAAIGAVACWALICRTVFPALFQVARHTELTGAPNFWASLIYSIVNAIFEELLWLGLGFVAFRRFGWAVAGGISVLLRLLVHAYQGPLALVTVLPVGIVFTLYYARTWRMWPVIVAHAFQDTLALSLLANATIQKGL